MTLWMWAGRHYVLVNVNKTRDRERTALWQDVDVTWMSTLTKCYCYYNYFIMISTAVTKKTKKKSQIWDKAFLTITWF